MLHELRIRDLAIIEDVTVRFGPGLNVLSGETGAGKSIILGALGLVLGGRASAEVVRTGRDSCEVSASFDRSEAAEEALAELGVALDPEDDGIQIRRAIASTGRSRAWVGSTAVSVAALRKVASSLVDYASQHEHQVLLDDLQHRGILDRFGALRPQVAEVAAQIAAVREVVRELDRLRGREDEQRARIDFLRFQLDELDEANPVVGDEEELDNERRVLADASRLSAKAREAEQALYGGSSAAVERLGGAVRAVRDLAATDSRLADTLAQLEEALIVVEDAGRELASYAAKTRSDPRRLQVIEDRLSVLHQLARKHRTDSDGLVAIAERLRGELTEIEDLDGRIELLERARATASAEALRGCRALTVARREAAARLAVLVEAELGSLSMERARFQVAVDVLGPADGVALAEGGPYANEAGADAVAFLLSANPGEELRALSRVASGGELSRILLAVRRALAESLSVQVQVAVFDEIDSGMGGATAESVAAKLVEISRDGQVLVITHLPRIAGAGDHHFRVEKSVHDGRTRTEVVRLSDSERVDELVRMVAGTTTTAAAQTFARELLDWRTGEPPP